MVVPVARTGTVFLGTIGRLNTTMGRDFTSGMSHAFIASVLICAVAIVFSVVREGRRVRSAASAQPARTPLPAQPAEQLRSGSASASSDLGGLRIARK